MNRLLFLLILAAGLFSCRDKAAETIQETPPADSATVVKTDSPETYLPIKALLEGEMRNVENYAAGILRKATVKGRKDSAFVKLPRFQSAAGQFMLKELDTDFFQDHFTETSFMDENSKLLNFVYTPKDSTSVLQKAVVYVYPGDEGNTMDRLYFETAYDQGDTLVEKRMTWKMRKYFLILTLKQPKSGNAITTMEKLIWDPEHFGDE